MLLSGFAAARNLVTLGYPFVEAVMSVLPVVDEFVIGVADSTDDTASWCEKLVQRFPKVRTIPITWPEITPTGTSIGAAQDLVQKECKGWYVWEVQMDECYAPTSLPVIKDIVGRAVYESYTVPFLHIQKNFSEAIPLHTAAYTRAVRIARNIPRVSSEHDGWQLKGWHDSFDLQLPDPVYHIGYEFLENICAKWASHALLYPDLEEYASMAAQWAAKLSSNDIDPVFTKTTSPYNLPPILKGLVGMRKYEVRQDLLDNPGKYVPGL